MQVQRACALHACMRSHLHSKCVMSARARALSMMVKHHPKKSVAPQTAYNWLYAAIAITNRSTPDIETVLYVAICAKISS